MEAAISSNAHATCHSVDDDVVPSSLPADKAALSAFVREQDDAYELALHVDGMHCARCIWAIESNLQKQSDVLTARVNLSTSRLHLRWQGAAEQAGAFASLVEGLGYSVRALPSEVKAGLGEAHRLLRAVAVAGFAMGNLMLISVALWSSGPEVMGLATRELLHWLSAAIALPTIAYAGRPFFGSALGALKRGHTNMEVPISLALILASAMSLFETVRGGEHAYFDSAVMLLFFLLIGRWLDARVRGKARGNAAELLQMLEGTATIIEDGEAKTIAARELTEGQTVRIAAGEQVPTDLQVVQGESDVDMSLVTGESLPKITKPGETLYGGTMNLSAPLIGRVLKASDDSLLADIVRLMEQAEQGRARYVRLADKAAQLYTPVVHSLAALAFAGWFFIGGLAWQEALMIAVTTLIITCPCALGLAVPVVQVLSVSTLMKRGILVKSGDALERLAKIDTVVLDKTGTLTLGQPRLRNAVEPSDLRLAASLAAHSAHPYSRAIAASYDGPLLPLANIRETAGLGIAADHRSSEVFLGKDEQGVALKRNDKVLSIFRFIDPMRPDASETVQRLQRAGVSVRLLSGDRTELVAQAAKAVGISSYQGDVLPHDKQAVIRELKASGHPTLMVGDGLNDAPSLAEASVSISPASGVDITQNSADIVFQGRSLSAVLRSWRIARFSSMLVKQNFALAAIYNSIAIPLALAGYVTPLVAAIAMSGSSLVVIANSLRVTKEG